MLILTNCMTDVPDEGCLKVASSLIKRIKSQDKNSVVFSYDRKHSLSDEHFDVNKLLLNYKLIKAIRKQNKPLLYIPFPAKTLPTALRIFILSLFSKNSVQTALVMKEHYNFLAKLLLKMSKSKIIVFSKDSYDFYNSFLNAKKLKYIKAGVDTSRFVPVTKQQKLDLKEKYGFDKNKKIVLHCGHLNYGRAVDKLLDVDDSYQALLVVSTLTKHEQDLQLKAQLLQKDNIRIIEDYVENIEEIYQMSDVYLFAVNSLGRCIDVPLSCLEAASCNIPVITTDFGEMKQFINKEGFYPLNNTDKDTINNMIDKAISENKKPRNSVLMYNWDDAVQQLTNTF